MGDAGGLEVTDGLAVEDDADLVVDDLDDEGLPLARFDVGGECGGATDDELLAILEISRYMIFLGYTKKIADGLDLSEQGVEALGKRLEQFLAD